MWALVHGRSAPSLMLGFLIISSVAKGFFLWEQNTKAETGLQTPTTWTVWEWGQLSKIRFLTLACGLKSQCYVLFSGITARPVTCKVLWLKCPVIKSVKPWCSKLFTDMGLTWYVKEILIYSVTHGNSHRTVIAGLFKVRTTVCYGVGASCRLDQRSLQKQIS